MIAEPASQQHAGKKPKRFYRSVWISDVHLGSREAQSELLYSFLDSIKCDYLYLVGDMIDLWTMRNKWHWPRQYNEIVHKLLKRTRKGAKIVYIPGNHDEFFRDFVGYQFGDVEIVDSTVHETADGRRLLVLHGDEFDTIVMYRRWLSHLGNWAWRHLLTLNRAVNAVRRVFGWPYWSLSAAVTRKVQKAVKHLDDFEDLVVSETRRRKMDGVICGHTHRPAMHERDGVLYCNTGDWMEHCTALVEEEDGTLGLLHWAEELDKHGAFVEGSRVNGAPVSSPKRDRRFWIRHSKQHRNPQPSVPTPRDAIES